MLEGDDGGSSDDHKGPRAEEGPSKASLLTRSEGSVLESDLGAAFDEGTWTSADHTPDSVGSRERALLKAGQLSAFVKQFGEEQRLDRGIDALDRYVAHPVTESQRRLEQDELWKAAQYIAGHGRATRATRLLVARGALTSAVNLYASLDMYAEATQLISAECGERQIRYARRKLNKLDAEDVWQDTLLIVSAQLPKTYPIESIDAFTSRILWRCIQKKWRYQYRHPSAINSSSEGLEMLEGGVVSDQDIWHDQEHTARETLLRESMRKLRPEFRAILDLHYFERKNYREIAALLEKPEGTVRSHAHRALKKLRKIMGAPQKKN